MGKLRFFMMFLVVLLSSGIYMTRNFMNMAVVSMVRFDNTTHNTSSVQSLLQLTFDEFGHSPHFFLDLAPSNASTHPARVHSSRSQSEGNKIFDSIVAYIHRLCDERFNWSTTVIAQIQAAFFFGYVFLQMQSASLADMHGGSALVLLSVFSSSIVSSLGPLIARNEWIFIFSRFICGLAQSCFLPAAFVVLMHWLPKQERTLGVTALSTSSSLGTVLIYFSSGFITTRLGWPYIFWIAGAYGLLTSVIAFPFLYSKPQEHPFISRQELLYITSDQSEEDTRRLLSSSVESVFTASIDVNANEIDDHLKEERKRQQQTPSQSSVATPWRHIFKNKSFLAILIKKVAASFLFSYDGSFNAIFNQTIVGLSPEINGIVSSCNCAVYIITAFPVTIISERIITNNWMSRTRLRRTSGRIELFGMATCRILMPFAVMYGTTSMYLSLMVISAFLSGMGVVAEGPIAREMSVNFGHSIYAFLNVLSVLASAVYPSIISLIIQLNDNSRLGWFIVHWIIGGLMMIAAIPYGIWASCERQPFDLIHS